MNEAKKKWKQLEIRIRNAKDALLLPILKFCVFLKITPNFVSAIALVLGLGAAVSLKFSENLFVVFIIGNLVFDVLDGSLARYKKQSSDKGFWLDYSFDRIVSLSVMIAVYLMHQSETIFLIAPIIYLTTHLIYAPFRKELILIYGHPIYYLLLVYDFRYATLFAIILELLNVLIFLIYLFFFFWKRHLAKRL